ncbi:methionyl-tRNA formyltransferase [Clostridia bacterium]|nr:methionyl-tRNA formyltransferase [Clostridia bacterium]
MGTPDFALTSLQALQSAGHEIAAVFTKPDRPKGRGMKLQTSPVKDFCFTHGIECLQPETLKDDAAFERAKTIAPDVIVVVAYGLFLPRRYLELARFCINVHGSLLPKYRGAAPIQWAVINGETTAGVCTMHMAREMDAGDVIISKSTQIAEDDTYGSLYDRLKLLGAQALIETLPRLFDGTAPRTPQDENLVTFAPPVTREHAEIDWGKSAREVYNLIRGTQPAPCATSRGYKIHAAALTERTSTSPCGTAIAGKKSLYVVCGGGGVLEITQIQPPNKKRMNIVDFLNGNEVDYAAFIS